MYGNNVDPQQLAQNPMIKKLGRIIGIILFFVFAIEIGLFILASYLIGSGSISHGVGYVFLIFIVQAIVGYSIKPMNLPGQQESAGMLGLLQMDTFRKARKFAGTLLMIPGFLTDIAAIILLIPPFRRGLTKLGKKFAAKKVSKMTGHNIDPEMLDKMSEFASKMGGAGGMGGGLGGFGGMGANGFSAASASASADNGKSSEPAPGSRKDRRRKRKEHKETTTVDVDYEIRDGDGVWVGGHSDQPTDMAVSMKHKHAPRHDDEDVIDVEADWK